MSLRLTSWIAAAALVAGSAVAATPAQATKHAGHTSLAEVLAADGNTFDKDWNDFDVLDRAVNRVLKKKPGSAVAVLADADFELTAFAPTDRAFRRLVHDLTGMQKQREVGVWRAIKKVADTDTIEAILLYHVVPGPPIKYHQAKKADGASLTTAQGGDVRVKVNGNRVKLRDNDFDDRNARVIVPLRNINRGNPQIAHGVNRVLRPIDL